MSKKSVVNSPIPKWDPIGFEPGLWEMTTSVIQQKGFPKTNPPYKGGDSLVSQKWLDQPLDPTTLTGDGWFFFLLRVPLLIH